MARQYAFADEMFQTNQGPSFPAHQYIVSGTSAVSEYSTLKAAENPTNHRGCGSPRRTRVRTIDPEGKEKILVYPCFNRESIFTLLDYHGINWRYYKIDPMYDAVDALEPIWDSSEYKTNVISPPSQFLRDIGAGVLMQVTFITPTAKASDHAGITDGTGPSWVASVVNAVGESQFWNSTAIFLIWDDWGGWYDHVSPKIFNSYELGFRVPLVVISPYAKAGYVSHKRYEFGSILKFIEKNAGLGSLGTTDMRANDPSNMFDFSQKPIKFKPIRSELGPQYFLHQPIDNTPVDDD
jgi:phospholipase C